MENREDREVWFGITFTGWWAKLTALPHWFVYAAASYGFRRRRQWVCSWGAAYTAQIAFGMLVWNLLKFGSLLGWYIWAFLTYVIGTKILPEPGTRADYGELLRTIGFSSAPGLIRIFSIIPGLGMPVNLLASIWMLVAMVIAVRQALDYQSTYRALGVCLIGWLVQAVILALLMPMMGEVPVAMLDN